MVEAKIGRPDVNMGLLSENDEKSLDDKGNPIIEGKLWSQAPTGMYLGICMHQDMFQTIKPVVGRTEISLGHSFRGAGSTKLSMFVSKTGKPTFLHEMVGACIELPEDLANDSIKRQYLTEWIVETVVECFQVRKIGTPPKNSNHMMDFMLAIAEGSEKAIRSSGL